ncbi:MAG TPA: hypothetical protein VGE07_28735 [Herpetosiphonaceae bacterium]
MRKFAVILALLLAACGQGAEPASQSSANPSPTPLPTVTSAAPTVTRATRAPATAIPPAPTAEAIPTITPEPAPPPTALPPTVEVIPTVTAQAEPATGRPGKPLGKGSILFNRNGAIWRFDVAAGAERQVAERGTHFRASPDGRWLAYVFDGQLMLADRDGQIDPRSPLISGVHSAPAWAPDSTALAVTTGADEDGGPGFCNEQNQVVVLELSGGSQTVGAGCQPAWAPESKRIAFMAPIEGDPSQGTNALRLVNRQGANGWAPVTGPVSGDGYPNARRIFYAPFWSADGKQLFAFGFDGYHALTDFSTLEAVDPTNGGSDPIGVAFDVIGGSVRVSAAGKVAFEQATAKGTAQVSSLLTGQPPSTFDYFGTPVQVLTADGPGLEHAKAPVWSPDGAQLAVVYCEADGYSCPPEARAEIRLISPDGESSTAIKDVDPESGLDWSR